ncbi:hypothetical protein CEXT_82931 [Caerostris extrusa]|uniref:Uncharacterized protein n=1 Tax=Caerostris extrusa TaxID=172846 RepID=A0AAV4UGZ2_CAEEX|nr:hypothetical protein CEXT_82931 [Caerostris extrusa]
MIPLNWSEDKEFYKPSKLNQPSRRSHKLYDQSSRQFSQQGYESRVRPPRNLQRVHSRCIAYSYDGDTQNHISLDCFVQSNLFLDQQGNQTSCHLNMYRPDQAP